MKTRSAGGKKTFPPAVKARMGEEKDMKGKAARWGAVLLLVLALTAPAAAVEEERTPVTADQLWEGSYAIGVASSSSMFRVVAAELTVADGEMEVCMTLSGTGYEKLFMGTSEEAMAAPDTECIYFAEDAAGKYTYTVPIEALDQDTDCAAWSIRKQKWYNRVLVFESDGLPEEAFVHTRFFALPLLLAAAAAIAVVLLARRRKKRT